jgi:uncharacterized phage protein gp47/JayE
MGVIIDTEGLPASAPVVNRVQEYVDPITLGMTVSAYGTTYVVGDGLGDGAANIGAHFVAVAPERVDIDVEFWAELKPGALPAQVLADVQTALTAYLKNLALTTPEGQNSVVRVSAVSSILYSLNGMLDYTDLTLNGLTTNLTFTPRQVAALGEVTVNVII